jgi:hypothetical protein
MSSVKTLIETKDFDAIEELVMPKRYNTINYSSLVQFAHEAAKQKSADVLKYLVELCHQGDSNECKSYGSDYSDNSCDTTYYKKLCISMFRRFLDKNTTMKDIRLLLECDIDPKYIKNAAINRNIVVNPDLHVLEFCIQNKVDECADTSLYDPNGYFDKFGNNLITVALMNERFDVVRLLIKYTGIDHANFMLCDVETKMFALDTVDIDIPFNKHNKHSFSFKTVVSESQYNEHMYVLYEKCVALYQTFAGFDMFEPMLIDEIMCYAFYTFARTT